MRTHHGMRHIAITVSDLERAAAFYRDALGMLAFGSPKAGGDVLPLVSPGLRDQITLVLATSRGETGRDLGRPGESGGIDHFGFVVPAGTNLARLRDRLEAAGAEFVERLDVARGVPSLFFRDPDGYLIQFTRFPRGTRLYVRYLQVRAGLRSLLATRRALTTRDAASRSRAS